MTKNYAPPPPHPPYYCHAWKNDDLPPLYYRAPAPSIANFIMNDLCYDFVISHVVKLHPLAVVFHYRDPQLQVRGN